MSDPLRILHIDDNPGDLTLAHEAFSSHANVRHEGMDGAVAAIGKLAQDALGGSPPALILLDLKLCGMDAIDVLRLLKSNPHLQRIPVVVLTSSDRGCERDSCLEMGAEAFITKPSTFEGLCEATKSVLHVAEGHARGHKRAAMAKAATGQGGQHGRDGEAPDASS